MLNNFSLTEITKKYADNLKLIWQKAEEKKTLESRIKERTYRNSPDLLIIAENRITGLQEEIQSLEATNQEIIQEAGNYLLANEISTEDRNRDFISKLASIPNLAMDSNGRPRNWVCSAILLITDLEQKAKEREKILIDEHNKLARDFEILADHYQAKQRELLIAQKEKDRLTNEISHLQEEEQERTRKWEEAKEEYRRDSGYGEEIIFEDDSENNEALDNALKLIAKQKVEIEDLKRQLRWNEINVSLNQDSKQRLENEKQRLQNQINQLETELADSEQDLTIAEELLDNKNQQISHGWIISNQQQAKITAKKITESKLRKKLKQKKQRLGRLNGEITSLTHQKEQAEAVNSLLARYLVDENHSHQQTQADLGRVNDDWQRSQEVNDLLARLLVETNEELNNERTRADNLQTWKDNHVCSITCQESCCVKGDYDTIQQERDSWKKKSEEHVCPRVDNSELATKDKKIAELEKEIKELKNKPPIQPDNSKINNLLTERTNLLATIQEKQTIIKELEVKLKEQPKEVVKEVESGAVIQSLKAELSKEQQSLRQLRYYSWLISGVCILLLASLVRVMRKRRLRKR